MDGSARLSKLGEQPFSSSILEAALPPIPEILEDRVWKLHQVIIIPYN